eukprot:sb/3467424/
MVTRHDLNLYYPQVGIILEQFLGSVVCCLSALAFTGYVKVHGWRKPRGFVIMSLLVIDFLNGFNGFLHTVLLDCSFSEKKCPLVSHIVFFIQTYFLWVSTQIILILNICCLLAIVMPFRYINLVSRYSTTAAVLFAYASGLGIGLAKRYIPHMNRDKRIYGFFVIFAIFENVVILGLAGLTLVFLNSGDYVNDARRRVSKSVFLVSTAYFFTYGYYQYTSIVYMIPGLPHNPSVFIWFTATGPLAISVGHIFLLGNSIFNGCIFLAQPEIWTAIQNICVRNYYRILLQRENAALITV